MRTHPSDLGRCPCLCVGYLCMWALSVHTYVCEGNPVSVLVPTHVYLHICGSVRGCVWVCFVNGSVLGCMSIAVCACLSLQGRAPSVNMCPPLCVCFSLCFCLYGCALGPPVSLHLCVWGMEVEGWGGYYCTDYSWGWQKAGVTNRKGPGKDSEESTGYVSLEINQA